MEGGFDLAIDDINGAGGVKVGGVSYKLARDFCDDQSTGTAGIACGRRLGTLGYPMIMSCCSFTAIPVEAFNEQDKFILMASSAVPEFTTKGNKLVVRLIESTVDSVPNLVAQSIKFYDDKKLPSQRAVVMAVTASDLGNQWAGAFKTVWTAAGRQVVDVVPVDANSTDFTAQVGAALNKKPDVVALTTNCAPTGILVNQFVEQGFKGLFVFGTPCTDLAALKPLIKKPDALTNATFDISTWALSDQRVDALKATFQKRFGFPAEWTTGIAYDAVHLLVRSMEMAGTISDVKQIRATMPAAVKAMGKGSIMGYTGLDDVGNLQMHPPVGVYQDGKMIAVSASK